MSHRFWIEYQQKSLAAIAERRRKAMASEPVCAAPGCTTILSRRAGPKRAVRPSKYCLLHTPTNGADHERRMEQMREAYREKKARYREKQAQVLQRMNATIEEGTNW